MDYYQDINELNLYYEVKHVLGHKLAAEIQKKKLNLKIQKLIDFLDYNKINK